MRYLNFNGLLRIIMKIKDSFSTILIAVFFLGVAFPLGASAVAKPKDVIAKVGDQAITFSQIDIMINSSDMVGMPIPSPGTQARNETRLLVLDKVISANLLYLDALKKGMQNDPVYQRDVENFSGAMLGSLYRRNLDKDITVTDEEVRNFYKNNIAKGTPFTPDVRKSIEARLREERFKARQADMQKRLREGVPIVIDATKLDPKGDTSRAGTDVVARVGKETIIWGELKSSLTNLKNSDSEAVRRDVLNELIDLRVAVNKARAAQLDKDPTYLAQVGEFKKVHLIIVYKAKLLPEMEPTDAEVREYFEKNKAKIQVPESRKIQMVVLKTKTEAEDVKKQIQSGKITIYEAVTKYSIDPNAKLTLGEFGWVAKGSGFPGLDRLTFSLKPDELGGPVESPVGWHLVKVMGVREARLQNIEDKDTWKTTKNMLWRERRDRYVTDLRTKNVFPVEVYTDRFQQIVRQEEEKIRANQKKSESTPLTAQKLPGKSGADQVSQ
jgi:parvulin-like peptidyl-prolyl isomerase